MGLYVDNLIIGFPCGDKAARAQIGVFLKEYTARFKCSEHVVPKLFCGMKVDRDFKARTLKLSMGHYIKEVSKKFLNASTKPFTTPVRTSPIDAFLKLDATEDEEKAAMRDKPYLSIMGCLLWIATTACPDIAYHASFLCQVMQSPSRAAYDASIAVLSYLDNTKELGITFDGNKPLLEVYTDASWLLSPKPFAGHVIMYCGATISYSARKLKIIPQSTAEAETAAYANAAKDLRFVLNVLHFLEGKCKTLVKIMCDNSATMSTIMKPGVTGRTKHYTNWL